MPVKFDPRHDLRYGWNIGEDSWNDGMDFNIVKLGCLIQPLVLSDQETTPPVIPNEGDIYIPAPVAIGIWAGFENMLMYFINGAWRNFTPMVGAILAIRGLRPNQFKYVSVTEGWKPLFPDCMSQPFVINTTLTVPPILPSEEDIYIPATGATGDWLGMDGKLVCHLSQAWRVFEPRRGMTVMVQGIPDTSLYYDGISWV